MITACPFYNWEYRLMLGGGEEEEEEEEESFDWNNFTNVVTLEDQFVKLNIYEEYGNS